MTACLIWYGHSPARTAFFKVSGMTLLRRAVLSAQAAGFPHVVVVVPEADERHARVELHGDRRIRTDVLIASHPDDRLDALRHLADEETAELAVVLGDRVWAPAVLKELRTPLPEGVSARLLEGEHENDPASGLARIRREALPCWPLDHGTTIDKAGHALQRWCREPLGRVEALRLPARWRTVRGDEDVRDAETVLLRALIKPADGLVARNINRRISTTLSRYLARVPLRPNHISSVVLLVGVCSGPFAFQGTRLGLALGGLCYWMSSVLDGCDGEISRLKHLASPLGAWVDTIVDDVVGFSFLFGLYFGLATWTGAAWWNWVGWITLATYVLTILPRYWIFVTRLGVGDHQKLAADTKPTNPQGFAKVVHRVQDNIFRIDFLSFSAMVTAVVGVPYVFALPYAVGSAMAFVDTLGTFRRFYRMPNIRRRR